ncbi:MAG: hypothetical protein QXF25_03010 [Candidatus Pacearchaeota archaeon]
MGSRTRASSRGILSILCIISSGLANKSEFTRQFFFYIILDELADYISIERYKKLALTKKNMQYTRLNPKETGIDSKRIKKARQLSRMFPPGTQVYAYFWNNKTFLFSDTTFYEILESLKTNPDYRDTFFSRTYELRNIIDY